jgi:hypothetical protein
MCGALVRHAEFAFAFVFVRARCSNATFPWSDGFLFFLFQSQTIGAQSLFSDSSMRCLDLWGRCLVGPVFANPAAVQFRTSFGDLWGAMGSSHHSVLCYASTEGL